MLYKVKDKSRPIVSIDLTAPAPNIVKPAVRKKRVSTESSSSKPVVSVQVLIFSNQFNLMS